MLPVWMLFTLFIACEDKPEDPVVPPQFTIAQLVSTGPFTFRVDVQIGTQGSTEPTSVGIYLSTTANAKANGTKKELSKSGASYSFEFLVDPGTYYVQGYVADKQGNEFLTEEKVISTAEFAIESYSPHKAAVGETIVLKGNFIGDSRIQPEVFIGDKKAVIDVSQIRNTITATVPRGITTAPIKVSLHTRFGTFEYADNFELERGIWTRVSGLPEQGTPYATFVIDNSAYFIVGGSLHSMWKYTPATNKWDFLNDFPGNKFGGCGFTLEGSTPYYVDNINRVWRYSYLTDAWTRLDDFPVSKTNTAASFAFAVEDHGYVAKSDVVCTEPVITLWKQDCDHDNWYKRKNYPGAADGLIPVGVIGKKAYVIGGGAFTFSNSIFVYNTEANEWSQLADGPFTKRSKAFALRLGEKLYYGGGIGPQGSLFYDCYEFDPETATWAEVDDIPEQTSTYVNSPTFTIDGKGYVFAQSSLYRFEIE